MSLICHTHETLNFAARCFVTIILQLCPCVLPTTVELRFIPQSALNHSIRKMAAVPEGPIRLSIPEKVVNRYLSFAKGEKAVLDAAAYNLSISAKNSDSSLYQIQSSTIGQLQVLGTLVPVGADSSDCDEGPIKSFAGDNYDGWSLNREEGDFYSITASTIISDTITYLVYNPSDGTVMWKRVGNFVQQPPPPNSKWFLEKL